MQTSKVIAVSTNGAGFVKANGRTMEAQLVAGMLVIFTRSRLSQEPITQILQLRKKKQNLIDMHGISRDLSITIRVLSCLTNEWKKFKSKRSNLM